MKTSDLIHALAADARPLDPARPRAYECGNPNRGPANTSRWNTGRTFSPPITQPDIWYSYNDNAMPPLGTPCLASYDGSGGSCPQLFGELYTTGVAPHGAAPYDFSAANANPMFSSALRVSRV